MADFSYLTSYDPQGKSAWFVLPLKGYEGRRPRLRVVYAGRTNKGYTNALAALSAKVSLRDKLFENGIDAEVLELNLDMDRQLFAEHVVTGWEDLVDADRQLVEFTKEDCEKFLASLPSWIMQKLSSFASRPSSFVSDDTPTDKQVEDLAGN
jgi:hypothetical protein